MTTILVPHIDCGKPVLSDAINYPDAEFHCHWHEGIMKANVGKTIVTFSEHIILTALRMVKDDVIGVDDLRIGIILPTVGVITCVDDAPIDWMRHNEHGIMTSIWKDGSGGFFEQRFDLYF